MSAVIDPHQRCQHKIYRLSCDEYDALWERSGGACEICRIPFHEIPDSRVNIDHKPPRYRDVRGLLCTSCNTWTVVLHEVGRRRDERAAAYLTNAWYLGRPAAPTIDVRRRQDVMSQLDASSLQYQHTKKAHQESLDALIAAIVAALRAGTSPIEVVKVSPFTDRRIRQIAREHGIEPGRPGRKPKS